MRGWVIVPVTRWVLPLTLCVGGLVGSVWAQREVPLPTEGRHGPYPSHALLDWEEAQCAKARAWIVKELWKNEGMRKKHEKEAPLVDRTDPQAVAAFNRRSAEGEARYRRLRQRLEELDQWKARIAADRGRALLFTPAPVWDEETWKGRGRERREVERALNEVPHKAVALLEQRGLRIEYSGVNEDPEIRDGRTYWTFATHTPRDGQHIITVYEKAVREIVYPELRTPPGQPQPPRTLRALQGVMAHEVGHGLWGELIGVDQGVGLDIRQYRRPVGPPISRDRPLRPDEAVLKPGEVPLRPGELDVQREWRIQLYLSFDKAMRDSPIGYRRRSIKEQFAQAYALAVLDPERLKKESRPIHDWFVEHLPPTWLRDKPPTPRPTQGKP